MGTYLGNPDGSVSAYQIKAYAQAAEGGAGLIFMDNAVPVPMTSCGLRADSDEFIAGLTLLADAIKEHGATPGLQIAHPGRDAGFVGSADVIGASEITYEPWYEIGFKVPRALSIEEIHELIDRFGDAALRAKKAGFEVVEIHGAAGCIPTNFLSPHDNKRTDLYGGSLHNRMRFLLEIVRNMKKKCGKDFPIGVKLSTEDWEEDGIRINETIEVAKALEKEGVAYVNMMGGTHATSAREFLLPNAFNAKYVKMVKDAVNIPVFIGHNIFTPEEAEQMLAEGNGDFVALGRSQLADPAWAKKAKEGRTKDIKPCINCMIGCIDRGLLSHAPIRCTVNPTLYKFECPAVSVAEVKKNVAVVGAGPAGCEAALTASKRGHHVTLYEKRSIGGAMIEASQPDNKANMRRLIAYYEDHLARDPNIEVLKKEANYEGLTDGHYDAVIMAIGGQTRKLNVPGADRQNVIYACDYLNGTKKAEGKNAVVIGGGITGAETALELKKEDKQVTIVEMTDSFLAKQSSSMQAYKYVIDHSDIKVVTGQRLLAVKDHEAVLVDRFGNETEIFSDSVVIAAGFTAQHELANRLEEDTDMEIFTVGDSEKVRQVYEAIHEGFLAARSI
jgi:2,4-dienoyl-CoA reductase-like NADH-dependent reductase (Old Yellow Enzyme family)/thioredoxin reductase